MEPIIQNQDFQFWTKFLIEKFSSLDDLEIFSSKSEQEEKNKSEPLHISLSRTVPLRRVYISQFSEEMQKVMHPLCEQIKDYQLIFNGWKWFVNDEKTRSFLSLTIDKDHPKVFQIVTTWIRKTDQILQRFQLPSFYADPEPHISFASVSGDVRNVFKSKDIEGSLNSLDSEYLSSFVQCQLPHPRLRIGKFLYSLCK